MNSDTHLESFNVKIIQITEINSTTQKNGKDYYIYITSYEHGIKAKDEVISH